MSGLRGELSPIGRAENGTTSQQQSTDGAIIQRQELPRFQQTLVSAKKAQRLPTAPGRSLGHGADDGVQPGTITPARDDTDALAHGSPPDLGNVPAPRHIAHATGFAISFG